MQLLRDDNLKFNNVCAKEDRSCKMNNIRVQLSYLVVKGVAVREELYNIEYTSIKYTFI